MQVPIVSVCIWALVQVPPHHIFPCLQGLTWIGHKGNEEKTNQYQDLVGGPGSLMENPEHPEAECVYYTQLNREMRLL